MLSANDPSSSSANFYQELPLLDSLEEALTAQARHLVPADWYVLLTDVINSTEAIHAGQYKAVNVAGGLAVMAIANMQQDLEFPFVFGGDGVTGLIAPEYHHRAHDILYDIRERVKRDFGMDIRAALVPVSELYREGVSFTVSKYSVSPYYVQAVFHGEGIALAESWLKDDGDKARYRVHTPYEEGVKADLTGFTCRWQDIPSHRGETISTIIKLQGERPGVLLREITARLREIFGEEAQYHPVHISQLRITHRVKDLRVESVAVTERQSGWAYWKNLFWRRINALVADLGMRFKWKKVFGWYEIGRLKDYQIASSDFQKFDGSFKIVLAAETVQRRAWEAYLAELHAAGRIYYGLHVSDRALMTCLLHAGSEREVHFIDAADGGYALAAKMLKEQMGER